MQLRALFLREGRAYISHFREYPTGIRRYRYELTRHMKNTASRGRRRKKLKIKIHSQHDRYLSESLPRDFAGRTSDTSNFRAIFSAALLSCQPRTSTRITLFICPTKLCPTTGLTRFQFAPRCQEGNLE